MEQFETKTQKHKLPSHPSGSILLVDKGEISKGGKQKIRGQKITKLYKRQKITKLYKSALVIKFQPETNWWS